MSGLRDELHRLDEGVHVPPTQVIQLDSYESFQ